MTACRDVFRCSTTAWSPIVSVAGRIQAQPAAYSGRARILCSFAVPGGGLPAGAVGAVSVESQLVPLDGESLGGHVFQVAGTIVDIEDALTGGALEMVMVRA